MEQKRQLTEAEKAFLKNEKESSEKSLKKKREKREKKKLEKTKHYSIFSWLIIPTIGIPVLGFILFTMAYLQAMTFFGGPEAFSWFLDQEITPEIEAVLDDSGLGWLPEFMFVMKYRNLIAILAGIAALGLSILWLWLDSLRVDRKKRELREVEENEKE